MFHDFGACVKYMLNNELALNLLWILPTFASWWSSQNFTTVSASLPETSCIFALDEGHIGILHSRLYRQVILSCNVIAEVTRINSMGSLT